MANTKPAAKKTSAKTTVNGAAKRFIERKTALDKAAKAPIKPTRPRTRRAAKVKEEVSDAVKGPEVRGDDFAALDDFAKNLKGVSEKASREAEAAMLEVRKEREAAIKKAYHKGFVRGALFTAVMSVLSGAVVDTVIRRRNRG